MRSEKLPLTYWGFTWKRDFFGDLLRSDYRPSERVRWARSQKRTFVTLESKIVNERLRKHVAIYTLMGCTMLCATIVVSILHKQAWKFVYRARLICMYVYMRAYKHCNISILGYTLQYIYSWCLIKMLTSLLHLFLVPHHIQPCGIVPERGLPFATSLPCWLSVELAKLC